MASNLPPGYSSDGDAATHGRDTDVFQELQPIRDKYNDWLRRLSCDLPNTETEAKAAQVRCLLEEISDELNTPL